MIFLKKKMFLNQDILWGMCNTDDRAPKIPEMEHCPEGFGHKKKVVV
jgi:hypothetical protein